MEITCGIYKITSPTNRVYIGQAKDIHNRWDTYRRMDCKNQPILYRSFRKYGVSSHKFEMVEICSVEKLNEHEKYFISAYDSYNPNNGMNCTLGGDGVRGMRWKEESRRKLSESIRKMYANGYRNHFTGKRHTEETKRKIGIKSAQRTQSSEARRKNSESQRT